MCEHCGEIPQGNGASRSVTHTLLFSLASLFRLLEENKSIDCDSTAHKTMVVYAWVVVLVICLGIPGGCFLLLWKHREAIKQRRTSGRWTRI